MPILAAFTKDYSTLNFFEKFYYDSEKTWSETFIMLYAHDRLVSCLDILLLKNVSFNILSNKRLMG